MKSSLAEVYAYLSCLSQDYQDIANGNYLINYQEIQHVSEMQMNKTSLNFAGTLRIWELIINVSLH